MNVRQRRKEAFRREALRRLRRIPKGRARMEDHRRLRELRSRLTSRSLKRVLLYLPLPLEVDLRPLIHELRSRGVAVYVPFMEGKSFRPVKYRLPLQKKRFGIYEPKNSRQYRPRKIDVAIVPIVGTDPTLRRIGFGQGFYDRFFEKEKRNIETILFVQRRLCYSPIVLTEAHDVRADGIIAGPMIRLLPED
ncbi:5-formyltetrahydrofolate cyclo-ligase [Nitratifractor sp.]|uniref:5-formyltetrahydrofolate cyclo-ligase n=1 Tax=Nitratifractor sp. TaxID=2268144 RepID=UPI0025EBEB9D|nr:5-formyltetrahydrofolate cyclo-ligase [Nitratifractor sp.]